MAYHTNQLLSLHPDNPHYFLFHGEPTVLITSGEHYGAVVNLDFDYIAYLDELQRMEFNLTRLFTGAYLEYKEFFNAGGNTLAPHRGRFLCPWARSDKPGAMDEGNKYDLGRWDDAYFERLHDFCMQASKRSIVVEISLFCPFYEDRLWELSPMNSKNNVNGVGGMARDRVYTLDDADMLACQEAMVAKIIQELNCCDNIYYEICNEPYWGRVEAVWQDHMTIMIAEKEKAMKNKHLIGINVMNGYEVIDNPRKEVDIFNFHYSDDKAVLANYSLNKVIGCNETGGKAFDIDYYRREAWLTILAGGGLFNHLDLSFAVGHERGTFKHNGVQTSSESCELRQQLRILGNFIRGFDFVKMKPDNSIVKKLFALNSTFHSVLTEQGIAYAVYLYADEMDGISLNIPGGRYGIEWVSPRTGAIEKKEEIDHKGILLDLPYRLKNTDVALRITRK